METTILINDDTGRGAFTPVAGHTGINSAPSAVNQSGRCSLFDFSVGYACGMLVLIGITGGLSAKNYLWAYVSLTLLSLLILSSFAGVVYWHLMYNQTHI